MNECPTVHLLHVGADGGQAFVKSEGMKKGTREKKVRKKSLRCSVLQGGMLDPHVGDTGKKNQQQKISRTAKDRDTKLRSRLLFLHHHHRPPSPLVLQRECMYAPSQATQPSAKWRLAAPRSPLGGHWPRPRDCNVAASVQSSAFLYFIPFFLQGVLDRHREMEIDR